MDSKQYNYNQDEYDEGVEQLAKLITEMHSQKDAIAKYLVKENKISFDDGMMVLDHIDKQFSELIDMLTEPTEFDD